MNRIEKSPPIQITEEKDFKESIISRQIKPEDFEILKELSRFPDSLFIEFHNFFNLNKDRSLQGLERQLEKLSDQKDERREFLELLHKFAKKYDWPTCWNLIRVFERREK